jgi:uncharacterized protein (DUF58 family)
VRLVRRRLYILPTRAGAGFTLLVLGMLVAGLNYANSLALLGAFVLGAFVIVAMNACHRNLLGLEIVALHAEPAFAGEDARLLVEFSNPGRQMRGALEIEAIWGPEPILRGASQLARLPSAATARSTVSLRTSRRGVFDLQRLRLQSSFPFGLFRAWTWLHVSRELLVFPRPAGAQTPPADPGSRERLSPSRAAGGDEWQDLRPFRVGDSPRQVAWKIYARDLPLLVKVYGGQARESLHFDLAAVATPSREDALSQIARWIVDAESRGARYRLTLADQAFAEGRGGSHQRRCLEALARAR